MVLTLISLAIFATSSIGSPVPQALPDVPGIVEVVNNLMGTPSGVPASQTTTSTQYCAARYTSQEYDTCASIGQPWGLSGNDILAANSFLNCTDIWPGTPICIPSIQPAVTTLPVVPRCQQTYTSVEKDTCDSIGTHFGVSGNDIYWANTFLNCNDIWPYTPICIPYPVITDWFTTTPPSTVPSTSTTLASTSSSAAACYAWVRSLEGDTCDKLAERLHVSRDDIYNANTFLDCNNIWTNTLICVPTVTPITATTTPAPTTTPLPTVSITATTFATTSSQGPTCYTWVRSLDGDTCDKLAERLHVSRDDIYNANTFLDCNNIWTNTPICVPTVRPITITTTPTPTTTSTPTPTSTPPSTTSTPSTPPTLPTCLFTVRSLEGDTCNKLAERHKVSSWAIQNANPFLNCNNIWTNTPICLFFQAGEVPTTTPTSPSCNYYSTIKGQTCSTLGVLSNLMSSDIYNANQFLNCNDIAPNTRVCIPKTASARPGCKHIFLLEDWLGSPKITCQNVARLWGTTADDIYNVNKLSCDNLAAGTLLCIPWSSPY